MSFALYFSGKNDGGFPKASLTEASRIEAILGSNFIGHQAYRDLFNVSDVGTLPPIPSEITPEFLKSRDPLRDDGSTIAQTHRLVLVPNMLDGQSLTVQSFAELARATQHRHGRGDILAQASLYSCDYFPRHEQYLQPVPESTWILIPDRDLPQSRDRTLERQYQSLENFPDYRFASVLEILVGSGMNDLVNRPDRASDPRYGSSLRCYDNIFGSDTNVLINFTINGFSLGHCTRHIHEKTCGMAIVRNINQKSAADDFEGQQLSTELREYPKYQHLIPARPTSDEFRNAWREVFKHWPENCKIVAMGRNKYNAGFIVKSPSGTTADGGFVNHTESPVLGHGQTFFHSGGRMTWDTDANGDRFHYIDSRSNLPVNFVEVCAREIIKRGFREHGHTLQGFEPKRLPDESAATQRLAGSRKRID